MISIPPMSSSVEQQHLSSMTIPQVNTTPEKKTRAQSRKSSEISDITSVQQSITNEQIVLDTSINDDNRKVQPFVSKSIEEKPNDIEKLGEKSSVGNSNAKLEQSPLSNEQQHLNQSISYQQQIQEEQNPAKHVTNDNQVIDLSPDLKSVTTKEQKIIKSKYSITEF
jgi:hypothetical protein